MDWSRAGYGEPLGQESGSEKEKEGTDMGVVMGAHGDWKQSCHALITAEAFLLPTAQS